MAEEESTLDKVKNSLVMMLLGIVMIPGSCIPVYFASQREQASEVLEEAYPLAEAQKAKSENKAVHVSGKLKAAQFGEPGVLKPGNYLSLRKSVQMYGYKSTTEKESYTNSAGEKKTRDVPVCETAWVSDPAESANGEGCRKEGKRNPPSTIPSFSRSVTPSLEAGGTTYSLDSGSLDYTSMPGVSVSAADLEGNYALKDSYIYKDETCSSGSPRIGCERFSYSGTSYDPAGEYTAIGMPSGSQIGPYESSEGNKYLKVGPGDYAAVMESLSGEDSMMTMILFGVSVVLLGLGLSFLAGPILSLIEFIPIIGDFGAGLIRVVFFIFAFVVMGLTFLLIEFWWLVLIIAVLAGAAILFIGKSKKAA